MCEVIATVLSGNSQELIEQAILSSQPYVDDFVMLDTGSTDATREVAERHLGERFSRERYEWCADFGKARNFALEAATSHGAAWAMTLDTDERLEFPNYASKEELVAALESDPKVRVWLVMEKGGRYAKERFIRTTGHGSKDELRWVGRVHEALVGARKGEAKVLPGVVFWEVKKSPEEYRAKLERDLPILEEETRDKPDDPRWWYYLGQTLQGLARPAEAVNAFRRCAALPGWAEQAAWACYKAAELLSQAKDFTAAIELCGLGLARQPGSPELAWLAGWCCFKQGRYRDAIHWERIAIALGNVEGCRAGESRVSFRHLPGWYEGPYDVLRHAYHKLGDTASANQADEGYQLADDLPAKHRRGNSLRPRVGELLIVSS